MTLFSEQLDCLVAQTVLLEHSRRNGQAPVNNCQSPCPHPTGALHDGSSAPDWSETGEPRDHQPAIGRWQ